MVKDNVGRPPGELGVSKSAKYDTFPKFSPSICWHCWLGNRKGIRPVNNRMLVCWWWQFGWSFVHLIAAVVTTSSVILSSNESPEWQCSGTGLSRLSWKIAVETSVVVWIQKVWRCVVQRHLLMPRDIPLTKRSVTLCCSLTLCCVQLLLARLCVVLRYCSLSDIRLIPKVTLGGHQFSSVCWE